MDDQGRKAYDSDVEFKCTSNDDWYGVPGQVRVDVRVQSEHDICSDGTGCRDEDASCKQTTNDGLLLPGQPQSDHTRDRNQHDDEVGSSVDTAGCKQMGCLVDALLACGSQSPVGRHRAVGSVSMRMPITSRHWHVVCSPALKSGNEEEDEAVESYDARDDKYYVSVPAPVDRDHPVNE